jgi:hypothetical protein
MKTETNKPKPSNEGISILFPDWNDFRTYLSQVEDTPDFMKNTKPCHFSHADFMDLMACDICSPEYEGIPYLMF